MLLRDAQPAHAGVRGSDPPALAQSVPPPEPSPWRGAEVGRRGLWAAASVLLALAAIWLLYVVVANIGLATSMPKRLLREDPDLFFLEYDTAWTVWPGTVHVRNLALASLEGPVWLVEARSAELDIDLNALQHTRLHVTRAVGEGVVVRVRTALERDAWGGRREQAMPPIRGYSDAQRAMLPEQQQSDEEYDRWVIDISGIDVRLEQLWLQEYLYRGPIRARGAFYVAPSRAVRIGPAKVDILGGELSVAGRQVASTVRGDVDVELSTFDPRDVGREVLGHLSGRLRNTAELPSMDWTDFYLGDGSAKLVDGSGDLDWDVSLARGVVLAGSWMRTRTGRLDVRLPGMTIVGAADATINAPEDGQLHLVANAPLTQLFRNGAKVAPPTVDGGRLSMLVPGDLAGPMGDIHTDLRVARAVIPDLSWVHDPKAPSEGAEGGPRMIGGRAVLSGGMAFGPDGKASGNTQVRLERARVMWAGVELRGWSDGVVTAREVDVPNGRLVMSTHVEMRDTSIHDSDDVWPGWWSSNDIDLELEMNPLSLHMPFRSKARDARPVLEILNAKGSLPGWIKGLVATHGVSAQGDLRVTENAFDFSLMRASGGPVAAAGRMHIANGKKATGAFLVRGGFLSLGVELKPDGNALRPLVGQDWLDEKLGVRRVPPRE
ncbi:MAG: hypothetical protein WKG00_18700 [Polyangiaceae bacterium]